MERKYVVLVIVCLTIISFVLSNLDYPPISKLVLNQLGLSNSQSGLITSIYFVPYALMQIPGGYLADRYGSARSLLVASFVMALSPLLFIVGNTFVLAIFSRIIAGVSGGVVFPSSVRLVSTWFQKNELSRAMSFFGAANGTGQLVASFFLPLLILGIDWRPPLLFVAFFSLLTSIIAFFPAKWTARPLRLERVKVSIRDIFTRNMLALMLPNFVSLAVIYGVFAWSPIYLAGTFHISRSTAGGIVSFVGLTTIAGSFLGGFSDKRLGSRKTIGLSMVLLVPFTILFAVTTSLPLASICLLGIGFGANLYFAADFSLIPYASKQGISAAGATFGVFNTLSNVGSVISPFLFGVILDKSGSFQLGYFALTLFAVLGIAGAALISLDALHY